MCWKKYAFCLSLSEPRIVWVDGCVPAAVADITLFRGGTVEDGEGNWDRGALYFHIPKGKRDIADDGLAGEPDKITIASPALPTPVKNYISDAKSRQETMHTRLKSFNILRHRFRHGSGTEEKMALHKSVVEALCVVIQYDYENGHPPFDMMH